MTRGEMLDLLRVKVCEVVFNKLNGEMRTMQCTLSPQYLPQKSDNDSPRKTSETTIRCFDVEKNDWRSFLVDSVVSFNGVLLEKDVV